MAPYPEQGRERDRWILARRTARPPLNPLRPYAFLREQERLDTGEIVPGAAIFLTNRECPWRCLMCDLWKNTLTETVPPGAIPAQIDHALERLIGEEAGAWPDRRTEGGGMGGFAALRQVKLYNSGSFFDPRAIPPAEHPAIAARLAAFDRVIVECHPALVNETVLRFRDLLAAGAARSRTPPLLEVAMGLETAHPGVLARLNKRMTLGQFSGAGRFLRRHGIALRVFILVKPPFLDEAAGLEWAKRSLDFAFDCEASVASLIPTRFGNGALEALAARGEFSPPRLATVEAAAAYGVGLGRGRVFTDLWDMDKFSDCTACFAARRERLERMNQLQQVLPAVECGQCE